MALKYLNTSNKTPCISLQLKTKYETKYLESRHFLKASVLLVNMFKVVFIFLTAYLLFINLGPNKRLGYVCNPSSLKEGTETSRRRDRRIGISLRETNLL